MKKIIPIVILFLGILAAVGAFLLIKSKNAANSRVDETSTLEETAPLIDLEKRPVVSLTPSVDGHWLKLDIKKIVIDAATLDYELTYQVPDGRTQGVPGTVNLTTKEDITKDLLLGSESSGKFRYDEGVERGNLSLKFRNNNGKLVAKFDTEFHLASNLKELEFFDGQKYLLDKTNKNFYVSMDTLGYLGTPPQTPVLVYGIFSSSETGNSGTSDISNIYHFFGNNWVLIEDNKISSVGYFIKLP